MQKCFQCEKVYTPDQIDERWPDQCPHCRWGGGEGLPEDDARYLVFLSLVHRAQDQSGHYRRLKPTAREFAMLNHGDQCKIDDVLWRITAKNVEKTVFYVTGWQVGLSNRGNLVSVQFGDDLVAAIKEQNEMEVMSTRRQQEYDEEARQRSEAAQERGHFLPEDVEFMSEDDWETLSEEESESLSERYEATME